MANVFFWIFIFVFVFLSMRAGKTVNYVHSKYILYLYLWELKERVIYVHDKSIFVFAFLY